MNRCNECKYYDHFNNSGVGGCHVNPPVLFIIKDEVTEHRPCVSGDDVACSLYAGDSVAIG